MRCLKASWTGTLTAIALLASCATDCGPAQTPPTAPTLRSAPSTPSTSAPAPEPPLVTFSGKVVEARVGPVAGVTITANPDVKTQTEADGSFSFSIPEGSQVDPVFERAGYTREETQFGVAGRVPATGNNVTMQRLLLMSESSQLSATLTTDDLWRWVGDPYDNDSCGPCKVITVRVDHNRRVAMTVSWPGTAPFSVWTAHGSIKGTAQDGTSNIRIEFDANYVADNTVLVGVSDWGTGLSLTADVPIEVTTTPISK